MRLMLLANLRVLARSVPAAGILVLFAVVAGFVSSYLYYGNMPLQRSIAASTAASDVEQFRFLPVLDLTDAELAELAQTTGIDTSSGPTPTLAELTASGDIDLVPHYESRARSLADRYSFEYEALQTKTVDSGEVHYELATVPTTINRAIVVDGTDDLAEGEIVLTVQYARIAGLAVGDDVTIDGTSYRIAGTYFQPGISLVGSTADSTLGNADNAGVLLTRTDFDAVDATAELTFVGRSDDADTAEIVASLRDDTDVASTTASTDLTSMSSLTSNLSTSLILMVIGTALFAAAILLVVWQVIRNNLRRSVAAIGVLKAMGRHPATISVSFAVYVLPVVVGVAAGAIGGFVAAPGFQAGYLATYNIVLPDTTVDIGFTLAQAALALGVPFVVCITSATRLVAAPALRLLDGTVVDTGPVRLRGLARLVGRFRLGTRVRFAFALSNLPRLLVVIVSAGVAVLVLAFSLGISSMATRPIEQLRQALAFENLVQYTTPQPAPDASATASDEAQVAEVGYAAQLYVAEAGDVTIGRTSDVLAVDSSFDAVRATASDGSSVFSTLTTDGIVVSAKLAADADLTVGDQVVLRPQALSQRVYTVTAVNPVDMDTRLYLSDQSLSSIVLNATAGTYTTWFAPEDANPTADDTTTVTSRETIVAQAEDTVSNSLSLVPLLVVIAIVLSVGVLFLIAYLNVFDNRRAIALLDQLGYQPRESVRLVINVYGRFLIAGAAVGALASPALLSLFSGIVSSASDYHLVLEAGWAELTVIVILVVVFAQLAHLLVLPWVRKISPAALAYA